MQLSNTVQQSNTVTRLFGWLFVFYVIHNSLDTVWKVVLTIVNHVIMAVLYIFFYLMEKKFEPIRLKGPFKSAINAEVYKKAWLSFFKNTAWTFLFAGIIIYSTCGNFHGRLDIQGVEPADFPKEAPGSFRFITEILICLFFTDFFMYWMHRTFHWGPLYKYIHSVHHEHHDPLAIHVTSVHIVELTVLTPVVFIVMGILNNLIGLHPLSMYCIPLITTTHGVMEHSGYDDQFEYLTFSLVPLSKMHYVHHQISRANYAFYFYFWDWLFGTKISYEEMSQKYKPTN